MFHQESSSLLTLDSVNMSLDRQTSPSPKTEIQSDIIKSVSFSASPPACTEILHLSDHTPELVSATWYSQDEFSQIATDNARICIMVMNGMRLSPIDNNLSGRGLEYLSMPDYGKRKQQLMKSATNVVFEVQQRQREKNCFDPEMIAEAYREISLYAVGISRSYAWQDKRDAQQINSNDYYGLPTSTGNVKKSKRRVRFVRKETRLIPHFRDFSKEVRNLCWYQPDDYKRINAENKIAVQGFLANGFSETEDLTVRGLDRLLPNIYKHRRRMKLNSINVLLDEQDLQFLEGINCPIRMARLYQTSSLHCVLTAQHAAQEDELFVLITSPRENFRRTSTTYDVSSSTQITPILKKTLETTEKPKTSANYSTLHLPVQSRQKKTVISIAARLA